jgi:hypothetical protein
VLWGYAAYVRGLALVCYEGYAAYGGGVCPSIVCYGVPQHMFERFGTAVSCYGGFSAGVAKGQATSNWIHAICCCCLHS